MIRFSDMGLSSATLKALEGLGFSQPTEVQQKAIPLVLEGKEVIVRSQTGTGKTAAFGISMIEIMAKDKRKKGLVLAPTRELALQITKELRAIAANHRLFIIAIYGGDDMDKQISFLSRGYDIVVATPGRLLDHSRRGSIDLSKFNIIVLDEADRMLDMGFRDDIDQILNGVSLERQLMLFSATIDEEITHISSSYMLNSHVIEIGAKEVVRSIDEQFIKIPRREKFAKLREILSAESNSRIIVFVSTQMFTEKVAEMLYRHRFKVNYLHGGMRQPKRERIMKDYREGRFNILVATDVAARGLHVDDVSLIINYDEAIDADTHTHRVGRTGRMGEKGRAITFIDEEGSIAKKTYEHKKSRTNETFRTHYGRESNHGSDQLSKVGEKISRY